MNNSRFLLLIAGIYIAAFFVFDRQASAVQRADAWGYYLHLPATFIYGDAGDYSQSIAAWQLQNPLGGDPKADKYGIRQTVSGKYAVKYPVGIAILELPFFAIAHLWCLLTRTYIADGFSLPYHWAIAWSALFYALAGLLLLYRVARQYVTDEIALVGIATVALGTPLFHYASAQAGMAHPCLFFLFAGFIAALDASRRRISYQPAIWAGICLGLIAGSRLPEVIVGVFVFPVVLSAGRINGFFAPVGATARVAPTGAKNPYATSTPPEHSVRAPLAGAPSSAGAPSPAGAPSSVGAPSSAGALTILLFLLAAALAFLPQLAYQKFVSGQWIYNSYTGETFHWAHPHIADGLFHYSNGWLIYSPAMVFALIGIFFMRGRMWSAFWPVILFVPVHIYICYAWWCWSYINGFGSRPMVEAGAVLLFPLLALLSAVWQKRFLKWLVLLVLGVCCMLNIFQTWQQNEEILWSEHANKTYYWEVFGKTHRTQNALIGLESNELQPDSIGLMFIKTLLSNTAEDSTDEKYQRQFAHSGQYSFRVDSEYAMGGPVFADTSGIQPGDYIKVSVWSYVQEKERIREIDKTAKLVIDFNDGHGKVFKIPGITITSKTGNDTYIPWHTGGSGRWGQASFLARVPGEFPKDGMIKAYIWNPGGQRFFADDFWVGLYRKQ